MKYNVHGKSRRSSIAEVWKHRLQECLWTLRLTFYRRALRASTCTITPVELQVWAKICSFGEIKNPQRSLCTCFCWGELKYVWVAQWCIKRNRKCFSVISRWTWTWFESYDMHAWSWRFVYEWDGGKKVGGRGYLIKMYNDFSNSAEYVKIHDS